VDNSELIFGSILVVALLSLAAYYGWRQVQMLRGLRVADERSPEERQYTRRQAWRRLVTCALMVVFAGLLVGSLALDPSVRRVASHNEEALQNNEEPLRDPGDRQSAQIYAIYWIITLLVLLAILVLAALDLMAIRRYGRTKLLQIQTDRRAMIESEIARLRRDRNGHA
jgi:hypothetical protein